MFFRSIIHVLLIGRPISLPSIKSNELVLRLPNPSQSITTSVQSTHLSSASLLFSLPLLCPGCLLFQFLKVARATRLQHGTRRAVLSLAPPSHVTRILSLICVVMVCHPFPQALRLLKSPIGLRIHSPRARNLVCFCTSSASVVGRISHGSTKFCTTINFTSIHLVTLPLRPPRFVAAFLTTITGRV